MQEMKSDCHPSQGAIETIRTGELSECEKLRSENRLHAHRLPRSMAEMGSPGEKQKKISKFADKVGIWKIYRLQMQMSCKEHMASLYDIGLHRRGWQEKWRGLCSGM